MTRRIGRSWVAAVAAAVAASLTMSPSALAAPQNDARSGGDAGNAFEYATKIRPRGLYLGRLDAASGDLHDYYKFSLREGDALSVLVTPDSATIDPVTLLDPNGTPIDVGLRVQGVGVTVSAAFTSEAPAVRLAVHRAAVAGEYRLHLASEQFDLGKYGLCFLNCEQPMKAPNDLIFGGALRHLDTQVLLVPPTHGDLGNPLGPTVLDYIDATLRGIHKWTEAMGAFAKDYPVYAYLREVTVRVEIFDAADPVDPAGYDVIIGYVAAGPAFRGVAVNTGTGDPVNAILESAGLDEDVHYSGRVIALSLFGSSPRVGQVLYDFPEIIDLEIVTTHEFGHTFGLGHTRYWHSKLGPDLMNSPATFLYGDGFPVGAGTERTKMKCLSSLNLYGMAVLYRWVPTGEWEGSAGQVDLPRGMPYKWYC